MNAWRDLLLKAWGDSFERRYHVKYAPVNSTEDEKGLRMLERQAEARRWDLHKAVAFFDASLEVIELDDYWKRRVGLMAAARKVNDTYSMVARLAREAKTRGTFDPEEFRKELIYREQNGGSSVAKSEMNKIRKLLGVPVLDQEVPQGNQP